MKYVVSALRILFFFILFSALARAEERQVEGGDLLYTGTAKAKTEQLATFLAEQQAIRRAVIECSIPHREIKVYKLSVTEVEGVHYASAQIGLPIVDCEEARTASPERKKQLTSAQLARDQKEFERLRNPEPEKKKEEEAPSSALDRILAHLESTEKQLSNLSDELQDLKNKPGQIVVREVATVRGSGSGASCQSQIDALMSQAQIAAISNTPSGNLMSGQALVYYNQAQALKKHCQ